MANKEQRKLVNKYIYMLTKTKSKSKVIVGIRDRS